MTKTIGVLLMTYGSPQTLDHMEEYLTNVRGGKTPPEELIAEFRRRYEVIGGSPLVEVTGQQAQALADYLNQDPGEGIPYDEGVRFVTACGMRFAPPYIEAGVKELAAAGVEELVPLILSPQYSPILMRGYLTTLEEAVAKHLPGAPVHVVEEWWQEPLLHRAFAARVEQALAQADQGEQPVPLLLTAHSMPKRVYEREPGYVEQLKKTAAAIAELVDHSWQFAYQSAGHTQEEWLRPDLTEFFPEFAADGHQQVVIAPVQFLADHLEILYDIDVAARQQAEEAGLELIRTASLNTHPLFIGALANVVRRALGEGDHQ